MKSVIDRLAYGFLPAFAATACKIAGKKKILGYAILIFGLAGLNSCFRHYYKTNSVDNTDAATIQKLVTGGKYFILHANKQNFKLAQVKVDNDNLEGEIESLPPEHLEFINPKNNAANRFKASKKEIVLYEVHLYTKNSTGNNSHINFPIKDFHRIDVYELDEKATNKSKVGSIVGITLTTAGIIAVIAGTASAVNDIGMTSNSNNNNNNNQQQGEIQTCSPQVYALNGNKRELAGILYSGAIFAPLQRTDYLPLSGIDPVNDEFHLQIMGGRNEELFIHETKLLQVTHNNDSKVLFDRNGKALVYRQPVKPYRVSIGENKAIKKDVSAIDGNYYSFTNHMPGQNVSDIILDFKKPAGVHSGKLLISAKNSSWAIYLFKKYKSLYGDYYATMLQQKDKADPKKLLQCELDQSLPLSVSVKTGNTWKFVDYFLTPGNEVIRDMIMEINLADFKNTDHIQIKLETTYMFWDLDYVGMDFSESLSCKTSFLPAYSTSRSGIISQQIAPGISENNIHLADKEYLNIDFAVKPAGGPKLVNSYFLAGNGYYHDKTIYEGKPQLSKLADFSKKGAFDKFSRQTFDELLSLIKNNSADNIAANN